MKRCPYCGEELLESPKYEDIYLCASCKKVFKLVPELPEIIQPEELKITMGKIRSGEIDWDGCI